MGEVLSTVGPVPQMVHNLFEEDVVLLLFLLISSAEPGRLLPAMVGGSIESDGSKGEPEV